jgi:hypothetical protein
MTNLPAGSNLIVYPDGILRSRPRYGERFIHNNQVYVWDGVIGEWIDHKGNVVKFNQRNPDVSIYDDWSQLFPPNINKKEEEEEKTSDPNDHDKKTADENDDMKEKEKLKSFFFPKNTLRCECGVWVTGSDRHSEYCRLYRKES